MCNHSCHDGFNTVQVRTAHNRTIVAHGCSGLFIVMTDRVANARCFAEPNALQSQQVDPYQVPKDMGIFQRLESPLSMTTSDIIQRIYANRDAFETRNAKKAQSEQKYYEQKEYVNEY